jgi:hypothetical protein
MLTTERNLQISTVNFANARVATLEDRLQRLESFASSLELEDSNLEQLSVLASPTSLKIAVSFSRR